MPQPIVPIHQQESMPITFGESMQPEFQLSELQQILLQATNRPQKTKYSQNSLEALQEIDKSTDLVSTIITDSNERYCSIPAHLNDETVLGLKAEGLIAGYGKSVKITDRGRTALRDSYLKSPNYLKENKKSDKFDYRSFAKISFAKDSNRKYAQAKGDTALNGELIEVGKQIRQYIREDKYSSLPEVLMPLVSSLKEHAVNIAKTLSYEDDETREKTISILNGMGANKLIGFIVAAAKRFPSSSLDVWLSNTAKRIKRLSRKQYQQQQSIGSELSAVEQKIQEICAADCDPDKIRSTLYAAMPQITELALGKLKPLPNQKTVQIDIRNKAIELLSTYLSSGKFIDNLVNNYLPNYYCGENANEFSLLGAIMGVVNKAIFFAKPKIYRELARERKLVEYDENTEGGKQLPDSIHYDGDECIAVIQRQFDAVKSNPDMFLLDYYLEGGFLSKFKALENKYRSAQDRSEEAEAEDELRDLLDHIMVFIYKHFKSAKQSQNPRSVPHVELQDMVSAASESLDLKDLSERILKQEFHKLPLKLKRIAEEHPEFVKIVIQNLIKTRLIFNTKNELGVNLATAGGVAGGDKSNDRTKGRGPASETEILFHLLRRHINDLKIDDEQKEDFLRKAVEMVDGTYSVPTEENPVSKPIIPGGRESAGALKKGLYQYTVPLTYAGLLDRYREKLGKKGVMFDALTPELKEKVINKMYNAAHNQDLAHLPHVTQTGAYTYTSQGHNELGPDAETIIKENLEKRLNAALGIHSKSALSGTLMVDPEPKESVIASVESLIKKYAFRC